LVVVAAAAVAVQMRTAAIALPVAVAARVLALEELTETLVHSQQRGDCLLAAAVVLMALNAAGLEVALALLALLVIFRMLNRIIPPVMAVLAATV
jgi:hypothetical protein